jgi:hypothetical protein
LTVWLALVANPDVLQPVMAGITAPSTNVMSAIVIQFIFFIVVSYRYFEPKILRCYGVLPASKKSL